MRERNVTQAILGEGITSLLAKHIAGLPSSRVTLAARAAASKSLIDAVGVSLAASGIGEGIAQMRVVAEASGPGPCSLIGLPRAGASVLAAAFYNGALAHAVDFEDVYDASPVHPNASVIPAALALAENCAAQSGTDFLAAIAIGADLCCRLALALDASPEEFGWYTPAIIGALGASATASRMLKLDSEQTSNALALTFGFATCSAQFKFSSGSMVRSIRDGFACEAAVKAALLAKAGLIAFDETIEGKMGFYAQYARSLWSPDRLTNGLGEQFLAADVTYKAWPACRGTHAGIDCALSLREQATADRIRSITFEGDPFLEILTEPRERKLRPQFAIDAKFSLPFMIAFAWIEGWPRIGNPDPEQLSRGDILALAEKVRFAPTSKSGTPIDGGKMTVILGDGNRLVAQIGHALGHPDNPLSDAALRTKFEDCAKRAAHQVAPLAIDRFIRSVDRLDEIGGTAPSALLKLLQDQD